MHFSTLFTVLAASAVAIAAPTNFTSGPRPPACSLANATLTLPSNQTALTVPTGTLAYVVMGVGVQNYTCGSAGTFVSQGALAGFFDISCAVNAANFSTIQDTVVGALGGAKGPDMFRKIAAVLGNDTRPIGRHYFITNSATNGTGPTPVFDFRHGRKEGNTAGFVAVKALGNMASPAGSSNIDWLMLQNIGGDAGGSLAQNVMRVDTKGGQPPASCTGNETTSVPYAAKYWMYN